MKGQFDQRLTCSNMLNRILVTICGTVTTRNFQKCTQQHMELRLYPSLEIGFGQLYQIYSNKQAHFLFSTTILNVGRARAATVDFAKYLYHRLDT